MNYEYIALNRDRSPFEWGLLSLPQQEKSSQKNKLPLAGSYPQSNKPQEHITINPSIPYVVAKLDINQFISWSMAQKRALYRLYSSINKKTIECIKNFIELPPKTVEEGLELLIALRVIAIFT